MSTQHSRRDLLRGTLALTGLGLIGFPEWALPALAQGEELVPFTDLPPTFNPNPRADTRLTDVRKIDGPFTPKDQFYTTQHYGHPQVDAASFKLKVTGLVNQSLSLSLADLKAMKPQQYVCGFECSGNRRPFQALASNGKWTGIPLKSVLDKAGVKADAKEFVFFGADHGEEEVEFRADKFKVDQNFGRSLPREKALAPEPILVWELNGEPLSVHQGFPLRLIVPGWYGVANVKWLSQIHLQAEEYLGKYQARWYRTLRGENIGGTTIWKESAVTLQQPKSFIARVTKAGSAYKALVVVLNDGSPIKSVEVKVDEGPWQAATADPATKDRFGWKLYTFTWNGATKGEHTLVSRLTETSGRVQPTADELASKKTFLEDNSQHPRKLTIA